MTVESSAPDATQGPCQSCGACCAYSAEWPRFWTDSDDAIARIPPALRLKDDSGMACDGDRCKALRGRVGVTTQCAIYDVRPDVCRACEPGDEACCLARERYGLEPLTPSSALPPLAP